MSFTRFQLKSLIVLGLLVSLSFASEIHIKGKISDIKTGICLDSVRISLIGGEGQGYSDVNGNFDLTATLDAAERKTQQVSDNLIKLKKLSGKIVFLSGQQVVNEISLFRTNGELVKKIIPESKKSIVLDISNLTMGTYIINLKSGVSQNIFTVHFSDNNIITNSNHCSNTKMNKNSRIGLTNFQDSIVLVRDDYRQAVYQVAQTDTQLILKMTPVNWITSDIHTHTYLTDGSWSEDSVVNNAFGRYGIDVLVNSEHGGAYSRDTSGSWLKTDSSNVYRWETLIKQSWPKILHLRQKYAGKVLLQGIEWNVPSHEHASVGFITDSDQPQVVSTFEYMFDQNDYDSVGNPLLIKRNKTHADAVAGAKYLQDRYSLTSYFITNHPSLQRKNRIEDLRDFNNVAPDVAFGIEGIPGHQKGQARGGYGYGAATHTDTLECRTYGGADYMIAKVGGLWDVMLGEGRRFWNFANSDFHDTIGDFWPGEYPKCYVMAEPDAKSWLDGMRTGKSYSVLGDLVNALYFRIDDGIMTAEMGETLNTFKKAATVIIRFKSPEANCHGDKPAVDHIDLINGDVTGKIYPDSPDYTKAENTTTTIVKRFTSQDWITEKGWKVIRYQITFDKNKYYRLRGTNLAVNTAGQTDTDGNPLVDPENVNNSSKAWEDLWFYSNPIFVIVK